MRIIPSLVEPTAKDLFGRIAFLSPYYTQFQVDIEDGVFIKNTTLSIDDFAAFVQQNHAALSPTLVYDFHLMVQEYEASMQVITTLKTLIHIDTILVHTKLHPDYVQLQHKYAPFRIGLVINPEEDVADIVAAYDVQTVPIIQLMTIHPGPQGQPFIPEALNKIEQLTKAGFGGQIYIDGAVNEQTVPQMVTFPHPPDVLCPGSYLAKAPASDLVRRVAYLKQ